jgi:hypothetical protein
MPTAADLTPEEIAAVLAARRRRDPLEDEIPASLAARLDREVAARVEVELAARGAGAPSAEIHVAKKRDRGNDGRVLGITSMIFGIPLMGIVEGTSHGNILGAAIVMAGIAAVNFAHGLGRHKDR